MSRQNTAASSKLRGQTAALFQVIHGFRSASSCCVNYVSFDTFLMTSFVWNLSFILSGVCAGGRQLAPISVVLQKYEIVTLLNHEETRLRAKHVCLFRMRSAKVVEKEWVASKSRSWRGLAINCERANSFCFSMIEAKGRCVYSALCEFEITQTNQPTAPQLCSHTKTRLSCVYIAWPPCCFRFTANILSNEHLTPEIFRSNFTRAIFTALYMLEPLKVMCVLYVHAVVHNLWYILWSGMRCIEFNTHASDYKSLLNPTQTACSDCYSRGEPR